VGTEARLACQRWPPGIATCQVRAGSAGSAGSAAPLGTSSPSSTSGDASRREHRSFIGSSPRRAEVTRRPPSTRRSSPRESTTTERPSPHGGQPNSGLGATRRPKPARRARTDRCERLRTCAAANVRVQYRPSSSADRSLRTAANVRVQYRPCEAGGIPHHDAAAEDGRWRCIPSRALARGVAQGESGRAAAAGAVRSGRTDTQGGRSAERSLQSPRTSVSLNRH